VGQGVAGAVERRAAGQNQVFQVGPQCPTDRGFDCIHLVGCGTGFNHQIAKTVHQVVVLASAAAQGVVAGAAVQGVGSAGGGQGVVAAGAVDPVVREAGDRRG